MYLRCSNVCSIAQRSCMPSCFFDIDSEHDGMAVFMDFLISKYCVKYWRYQPSQEQSEMIWSQVTWECYLVSVCSNSRPGLLQVHQPIRYHNLIVSCRHIHHQINQSHNRWVKSPNHLSPHIMQTAWTVLIECIWQVSHFTAVLQL